jgi:hypothetical protein
MPNNSNARRNKNGKRKKRRDPSPLVKQVSAESVDYFLSLSSAEAGRQEEDEQWTWESVAGEAALYGSLSSFSRLSSSAEPKEILSERRRREKELLEKELDDEFDISLSDDSSDKEDPKSGNRSLSPSQFLEGFKNQERRQPNTLELRRPQQHEAKERLPALSTPVQVLEAKGMEASGDGPIEVAACVVTTGVDTIQLGNPGHPQGSSPATLSSLFQYASNRACASASPQSCSS